MCGLVMVITKFDNGFSSQQQDIFSSLLYLSGGFRGRDGAGVVVIDNLGNVNLAKDAGSVDSFIFTEEYSALNTLAFKNGRVMMGHNRAATRGTIKDSNAHPFIIDDKIVVVHNGTFYGNHKHIKDTEVDSEAIGHLLAENDDIEEALKQVHAAYALMWYNVPKKEVNIVRNVSRPLYYMETASSYIYASEEGFLKFVIDKFNLSPLKGPYLIKEYNLSSYTLKENGVLDVVCQDINCTHTSPITYGDEEYWENYVAQHQQGNNSQDKYYQDIFQKTVECMGDKLYGMKHRDWALILDQYKENRAIAIEPLYWIEDCYGTCETGKKDYLIVGQTRDGNGLNACFKVYSKTETEVQDMVDNYNYTMIISRVTWRRVEEIFPVDEKTPMNEWMGVPHVQGYNPKPILELEHYVH